jgi:hypothetical protein
VSRGPPENEVTTRPRLQSVRPVTMEVMVAGGATVLV